MRHFTKVLLLTLVAMTMGVSADAQESMQGYFRVLNVGYLNARGTGVSNLSSPTTAYPKAKRNDAVTMPGTVFYINAKKENQEELKVLNFRSQGVDITPTIFGPTINLMKEGFSRGLNIVNRIHHLGLEKDERNEVIDAMFDLMQMYLEPTTSSEGNDAYYIKFTTPDPQPLADLLISKGVVEDNANLNQELWNWIYDGVVSYCEEYGDDNFMSEWDYYFEYEFQGSYVHRFNLGRTYNLIGGHVKTNFNTHTQRFDMGPVGGEFTHLACNNTDDFPAENYSDEVDIAGDFAKWYIEEIVPGTETSDYNYFALDATIQGRDEHYYQTLYTDFDMQIVPNGDNTVQVWGIAEGPQLVTFTTGNQVAYVTTVDYNTEPKIIPARTPVVIECKSASHVNNLLQPVGNPVETNLESAIQSEKERSFLRGIFFNEDFQRNGNVDDETSYFMYKDRPLDAGTAVARKNVRVFNVRSTTKNPLGFFKYSGGTIIANRAFMILDDELANANIYIVDEATGISEVTPNENENKQIFDIQGRIVNNPTKGLYIVNGKKMVVK